jgi:mRNA-degrading endonuclease RelE of RelBE toxin-antitoxin system
VRVLETPSFRKDVKRLHGNQKGDLDLAVRAVLENPAVGDQKLGDLAWLRVYKFRMVSQVTLLAYERKDADTIILHAVGSHENFYRDLKTN